MSDDPVLKMDTAAVGGIQRTFSSGVDSLESFKPQLLALSTETVAPALHKVREVLGDDGIDASVFEAMSGYIENLGKKRLVVEGDIDVLMERASHTSTIVQGWKDSITDDDIDSATAIAKILEDNEE